MKITVGDVMNSRNDVRDYLSVSEEDDRIYVKLEAMDVVLIDRTAEWDELRAENDRMRKALEFYAEETQYMYKSRSLKGHPTIINDEGATARQALKGE